MPQNDHSSGSISPDHRDPAENQSSCHCCSCPFPTRALCRRLVAGLRERHTATMPGGGPRPAWGGPRACPVLPTGLGSAKALVCHSPSQVLAGALSVNYRTLLEDGLLVSHLIAHPPSILDNEGATAGGLRYPLHLNHSPELPQKLGVVGWGVKPESQVSAFGVSWGGGVACNTHALPLAKPLPP